MELSTLRILNNYNNDPQEFKTVRVVLSSQFEGVRTGNYFEEINQDSKCDNHSAIRHEINQQYPQFKEKLVYAIHEIPIESGKHYEFEDVFDEYYVFNDYLSIKLLECFLREFYDKKKYVKAVLHIVSHYTYEDLGEDFVFPVLSLLGHEDKGIRKFALKVFDNWDSIDTLSLLRGSQPMGERWLNDFKGKIISRLERKKTDAILFTCN